MAKKDHQINISFDASMDVQKINKSIQEIAGEFSKLKNKVPEGMSKSLLKNLEDIQGELENFLSLSNSISDGKALKKTRNSLEEVHNLYTKINKQLRRIKGLDTKSLLPDATLKNLERADKAVTNYTKQMKDLDVATEKTQQKIKNLIELKREQASIEAQIASKKSEVDSARETETKAKYNRVLADDRMKEANKRRSGIDKESEEYKQRLEKLESARDAAKDASTMVRVLESDYKDLLKQQQSNLEVQKSYTDIVKNFGSTVEDLQGSFSKVGEEARVALGETLRRNLEQLGVDTSELGEDLTNIGAIAQQLSAEGYEALANSLQKIIEAAAGAEPKINNLDERLKGASQNYEDFAKTADEIENLQKQIVNFFSIGNAISLFKRAVSSAYSTVKDLDAVMTETAVVTDYTVGDMWRQLPEYTDRANELGVGIQSAYEAATLYYQQGLRTNQVIGVSNETLKMARIASMDATEATNLMTAALRGFNMEVSEMNAQRINDVYSNLAAISAADTREIGVAMSKTASIAHSANMEFETTSALLTQIIETTREAPETAGTAMKTIIARFTEIKKLISEGELLGIDAEGEEIDVNKLDRALKMVGISLSKFLRGEEGIDDVFLQLAEKWDTLDIATQRYIATMAAGSRQQSRFLAMMSDWDRTQELVKEAKHSEGASQDQFEKTLDSMESKLAKLTNAWEEFVMGLANNNVIKGSIDLLTQLVGVVNTLIKDLSGGNGLTKTVITLLTAMSGLALGKSIIKANRGVIVSAKKRGITYGQALIEGVQEAIQNRKGATGEDFLRGISNVGAIPNVSQEMFDKLDSANKQSFRELMLERYGEDTEGFENFEGLVNADQIKDALAEMQDGFKLTRQEALEFGLITDNSLQNTATAAQVAGVAILGLSTILKGLGAEKRADHLRVFGTTVVALGMSLKMVGTIAAAVGKQIAFSIPQMARIGAGIAAISALVTVFTHLHEVAEQNSLAGQLQAAEDATSRARDAAARAKTEYDQLLSARDNYTERVETLDNLAKGTQKWKEALVEANDQVLQLLATYPELAQYISRQEGGSLRVADEGWDRIIEKQQKGLQMLQASTLKSQANEAEIKLAQKERKLYEQLAKNSTVKTATLAGQGSDRNIRYDRDLKKQLEGFMERGDFASQDWENFVSAMNAAYGFQGQSETWEETEERLKSVASALARFNDELANTETAVQSQTEAAITAALGEDALASDYADTIIRAFVDNMDSRAEERLATELESGLGVADLMGQYGLQDTGVRLTDLGTLYKELTGMEAPDDIKDDQKAMAEEVARLVTIDSAVQEIVGILTNMDSLDPDTAKKVGLLLGSGKREDITELDDLGPLSDYAEELGYDDANAMAVAFGKESVEELNDYGKRRIEDQRLAYEGAIADLTKSGVGSKITNALSMDTAGRLSEQTKKMSAEDAKDYVEGFVDVINDSSLDKRTRQGLENYLSSIDWSDMSSSMKGLEFMTDQGVGIEKATALWETATKGAKTAITNMTEANRLTELFQSQMQGIDDMKSRLTSGTGTADDVQKLIERGADPSSFQLTKDGWYATEQGIEGATQALYDFLQLQAQLAADKSAGEYRAALDRQNSSYGFGRITTYDETTGQYSGPDDLQGSLGSVFLKHEGISRNDYNSEAEYWKAANQRYQDYLNLLNNGKPIQEENQNRADMLGSQMSAKSNELRGGTEESVLQSAQREVSERGLDPNELADYVDELQQANEGLDRMRAIQTALGNTMMNRGLSEIISSYSNWKDVIDTVNGGLKDTSAEGVAAFNALRKSVSKMLGSADGLSDEFFQSAENLRLIEEAAQGSTSAVGDLQKAAAEDIILHVDQDNLTDEGYDAIAGLIDLIDNTDLPELEPGMDLSKVWDGTDEFANAILDMAVTAGMGEEQITAMFQRLGFDVKLKKTEEPLTTKIKVPDIRSIVHGDPTLGNWTSSSSVVWKEVEATSTAPGFALESITSRGSSGGGISRGNASRAKANKPRGGGGGAKKPRKSGGGSSKPKSSGGTKEEKPDIWVSTYDELYNLSEQLNESIRRREMLERRYDKILKNRYSTTQRLINQSLQEIAKLKEEESLQKKMQEGRRRQIQKIGSQKYEDKDGNIKTLSSMGALKYASYNESTGRITIDWESIDKVTDPDKGGAIEAYISKLEELVQSFEETQTALLDIEDRIQEIQERGKQEYVDFEQRIFDAIAQREQKIIDNYQQLHDTVTNSNSSVLDALRESISLQRQIRDNTKTEEDISDKESRLAYLRRDTSGANDLDIQRLEKELDQAKESYGEKLIDQEVERLAKSNEEAAEQRAKQIEIAQAQLDYAIETGEFWGEVSDLLHSAFNADGSLNNNSALVNLLRETEGFKALSDIGQYRWIDDLIQAWLAAQEGQTNWRMKMAKESRVGVKLASGEVVKYNTSTKRWDSQTKGRGSYGGLTYDVRTGQYVASGYSAPKPQVKPKPPATSGTGSSGSVTSSDYEKIAATIWRMTSPSQGGWNNDPGRKKNLVNLIGASGRDAVQNLLNKMANGDSSVKKKLNSFNMSDLRGGYTLDAMKKRLKKYKQGGKVDFTGPAWLDGTPTKPETILNATDTKNFIELKDTLQGLLKNRGTITRAGQGDAYYDINIEVAELASDYDVDQLAKEIKNIINSDARYRNVNSINFIR